MDLLGTCTSMQAEIQLQTTDGIFDRGKMRKKALLIGINYEMELQFPQKDVERMKNLLISAHTPTSFYHHYNISTRPI